jgi:preprotein translocase subunit SecE
MDKIGQYFRDTLSEMKQVKWPTQNQAMVYTGLVIAVVAVVAIFVGLWDFVFATGIKILSNSI